MAGYSASSIIIFSIIVVLCLAIDLFAHKQDKEISVTLIIVIFDP